MNNSKLIDQDNPLLNVLSPFYRMSELPEILLNEPLIDIPWRLKPPCEREIYLHYIQKHYWPIQPQLEIAAEIQLMLRNSLEIRNPLSIDEQKRINMLAMTGNSTDFNLQSLRRNVGGSVISAITGLGKTFLVERALSIFAPNQVYVHSKSEVFGWSSLVQIAYLFVEAPSNGTRKALLRAILGAIDGLIGTDYAIKLKRETTIDDGALFTAKTLSNHRIGILVIDENQYENFAKYVWSDDFVKFYLALLNLGIPVLLLGNPSAFVKIEKNSQLLRRFSTYGWHKLIPSTASNEIWWEQQFIPGITKFTLCDQIPPVDKINKLTFDLVGGNPGLFRALWTEANKIAIRKGNSEAILELGDFETAVKSPSYQILLDVALGIKTGNSSRKYVDIPIKAEKDTNSTEEPIRGGPSNSEISKATTNIAAKLKSNETRVQNNNMRNERLKNELNENDLRLGVDAISKLAGMSSDQGEFNI